MHLNQVEQLDHRKDIEHHQLQGHLGFQVENNEHKQESPSDEKQVICEYPLGISTQPVGQGPKFMLHRLFEGFRYRILLDNVVYREFFTPSEFVEQLLVIFLPGPLFGSYKFR